MRCLAPVCHWKVWHIYKCCHCEPDSGIQCLACVLDNQCGWVFSSYYYLYYQLPVTSYHYQRDNINTAARDTSATNLWGVWGGEGGLSLSQCLEPCETLDNFLTGKLNTPAFSVWDSCFILSLAQTLLGQFSVGNKKRLKSDQARHEVWSFYTTHNDVLSSFYSLQQFACRAQNAL